MSSEKSKYALAGITIAASLLLAFSVSISFNWYYTNYYLKQEITNIFNELSNKLGNQTQKPIIVNVTIPSNITEPQPNVTQPAPTPKPVPVPAPTPTCISPTVWNATNQKCQTPETPKPTPAPIPIPAPTPTPTQPAKDIKVIVVGDIEDSTAGNAVLKQIIAQKPDLVAVLGDLGYESNIQWFKDSYGKAFPGKLICVPGNHDSTEDGSTKIYAETQKFCGEPFFNLKPFNGALFLGIDTNGNLDVQLGGAQQVVMNTTFMKNVKSVHVLSHKGCISPPNSHHPAPETTDIKTFCTSLAAKMPATVKQFWDAAHNHVMSESTNKVFKQSGAGGRSHYECPTTTTTAWWCDNKHFGFLEYMIKPDGTTTSQFKDYNGKVIH